MIGSAWSLVRKTICLIVGRGRQFNSKWIYLAAIYPLLVSVPYFGATDRYNSLARILYVFLCTLLAASLIFCLLSSRLRSYRDWIEPRIPYILFTLAIFYGLITFYLAYVVRIRNGMGIVEDVANFEQVIWGGSQGRFFYSSFNGGSYLSGHCAPILILLSLIYKVFPDIGIIFFIQSLLLCLAVVPLYLLAQGISGKLPALIVSVAFLVSPAVVSQNFGLYLSHFSPFFWLAASFAFWRKNIKAFVLASIMAASVQEDIAFSLLVFALLAWREKYSTSWRLYTTLFPLVWFILAMSVIQINSTSTGKTLGGHFTDLGQTPNAIAQTLVANPGIIAGKFSDALSSKILWAFELLAPFLFVIPFMNPLILGAVPDWIVFNFIPLWPDQHSVAWYYSLLITTIFFASFIYSLGKFAISNFSIDVKARVVKAASVLVLCVNLAMLPLVISPDMFAVQDVRRMAIINKIKALMPADACVVVSSGLTQPFAQRYQLYGLSRMGENPSDCRYIVIDESAEESMLFLESPFSKNYQLLFEENQIRLLVRN